MTDKPTPTDAMVLAALQIQYPAAYGKLLRHPANGPKTAERTEAEIDTARRMIAAALAAAPTPPAQADSVPAIADLPPLPDIDLRDVGTKPQEIKEFLKGYATEYARTAIAARAQADSVQEDAARWRMAALIGNEVMLPPDKRTHATAVKAYMDATHSGSDLTGAVDAAIAARGGK